MNKKRWMAAALAGAMALTMTACGGGTEDTPADDSASTAESTNTEQSTGGEAKKVSVILKTLVAGETRPVIAVDSDIPDTPEVLSFVGTGNEAAAKLGGQAAVEAAKAAGWTEIKAIEICGVQGEATSEARKAGYMAGIEESGGDFLEEETQYADATADRAVNAMEAIMQTHPEGVAIICAHNDDMAMAAARAAASNPAYENTIFMGFNGDKSACESILKGELTMSVAQNAYDMAYKAVETACNAVAGQQPEKFVDSGADIITSENAQERLDTLNSYLK